MIIVCGPICVNQAITEEPYRRANFTNMDYINPNMDIGATVDVWEWISDFNPHFPEHVINYPGCD